MTGNQTISAEQTMRPNPETLVEFFSRSLSAFQSSQDAFRVLCTLPHTGEPSPRRPRNGVQKLIVMDSSFNPPTVAHAQMARSALVESQSLPGTKPASTRLMLLLAVKNADKAPTPVNFPMRLCMMDGFGHGLLKDMHDSDLEIDLAVTTMPYFHSKASAIKDSAFYRQDGTQPEQIVLCGFDTVIRIFNPKYYGGESTTASVPADSSPMRKALEPFFASSKLRVTMRPDDDWGTREEQREYVRKLADGDLDNVGGDPAWAGKVDLVEASEGVGVSSSKVRDLVKNGQVNGDLEKLVGNEVKSWIDREAMYR